MTDPGAALVDLGARHDPLGTALADMAPLLRRVGTLDPRALARIRAGSGRVTVLARLPFQVLVARTVESVMPADLWLDRTVAAADLLAWLDGDSTAPLASHDAEWRGASPPVDGWRRLDTVPDDVIRGLVRSGAVALQDAARREGVPGAQPRAEIAEVMLDSVVLTADDNGSQTRITLRTLSALTRMGFLARDSHAAIDVAGRWIRVAGGYGSVFAETSTGGLGLLH